MEEVKNSVIVVLRTSNESNEAQHEQNWNLDIYFAILMSVFLYCVVLIIKINFGSMVITHITTRPYKISLLLITMFLSLTVT